MSDISDDPRFWALSPSQGRAIQLLPKLMQAYGRGGVLHWTRKELRLATHLGKRGYEGLLEALHRHEWGGETAEGWLTLSGPLAPSASLVGIEGAEVRTLIEAALPALINQALQAAVPAIIEEARPGIIKEHEAQKQREYRVRKQGGENVIDKPTDKGPNVIDNPLRTRAPRSIDSNRVDLDNILSIDSISNESNAQDAEPVPDKSAPTLTMVPADVAQEMVRKGISSRRAGVLIEQYSLERCATVLACLPHWKFDNAGKAIEDALKRPEVWPIPKEVAQQKLPLLTGQPGGAAARPASMSPEERQRREEKRANVQQAAAQTDAALADFRSRFDDSDCAELERMAMERLNPLVRQKIVECRETGQPLGNISRVALEDARRAVLAEALPVRQAVSGCISSVDPDGTRRTG